MNDSELKRWAEQQEAARDGRGGMVLAALVTVLALLTLLVGLVGGLAAFTQWAHSAMLGGAL